MTLEELRIKINEIDNQMSEAFINRMKVVEEIANYKLDNNLPIYNKEREEEVVNRNCQNISSEYEVYYKEFITKVMELSKKYQEQIIKGAK